MSTPYNVAQHLGEMLVDRSALALVDGQIWDMHRSDGNGLHLFLSFYTFQYLRYGGTYLIFVFCLILKWTRARDL